MRIKELESSYWKNEDVKGIVFEPVKLDERACSYNTNKFVIFYGDILAKLRIDPLFTFFQVDVLNMISICPSQLTWNA